MAKSAVYQTEKEAQYALELARTERDIYQTMKKTFNLQVRASTLRARLGRIRAQRAGKNLANAELQVGIVAYNIKRQGFRQHTEHVRHSSKSYSQISPYDASCSLRCEKTCRLVDHILLEWTD